MIKEKLINNIYEISESSMNAGFELILKILKYSEEEKIPLKDLRKDLESYKFVIDRKTNKLHLVDKDEKEVSKKLSKFDFINLND